MVSGLGSNDVWLIIAIMCLSREHGRSGVACVIGFSKIWSVPQNSLEVMTAFTASVCSSDLRMNKTIGMEFILAIITILPCSYAAKRRYSRNNIITVVFADHHFLFTEHLLHENQDLPAFPIFACRIFPFEKAWHYAFKTEMKPFGKQLCKVTGLLLQYINLLTSSVFFVTKEHLTMWHGVAPFSSLWAILSPLPPDCTSLV